jgi:hypothetical protein
MTGYRVDVQAIVKKVIARCDQERGADRTGVEDSPTDAPGASQSLDDFARRFALSRRGALKALAGGAAAAVLAAGSTPAWAKPSTACRRFCEDAGLTGGAAARCRQECDACGGDPSRLCPTAAGPVCCTDPNPTCYQGQCQCVGFGGIADITTMTTGPECPAGNAGHLVCPAGTTCRTCVGSYEVLGPGSTSCGGGRATCCQPGTQFCAPLPYTDANATAEGYCTYPTGV